MRRNDVFEKWYSSVYDEWWKDHKRELLDVWNRLEEQGIPNDVIVEIFSTIVTAIRDQYGD